MVQYVYENLFTLPIFFLGLFIFGRICSFYQTRPTKFYYHSSNKRFEKMFEKTGIKNMIYRPWTFALNGDLQAILFIPIEIIYQYIRKIEF